MIKRLEIKNFENHEHAVFENFSPDFNLICGPSDSGKSSIIRAIKLISFNEFDAKCIRTGAKFCEVTIETEKGKVFVRRSKTVNNWEVTPCNGVKKEYNSIGKAVLEEVSEIIGLKIIQLGDVSMKVNVMDQLESHFLLSSIDGNSSSGSIRAQIIDEISGLAGIETVIKEVSSDHLKYKKENNIFEERNKELIEKLNNEDLLKKEEENLKQAENLLKVYSDCLSKISSIKNLNNEFSQSNENCKTLQEKYDTYPHDTLIEISSRATAEATNKFVKIDELNIFRQTGSNLSISNKKLQEELKDLANIKGLEESVGDCKGKLDNKISLEKLANDLNKVNTSINDKQITLDSLPNIEEALIALHQAENNNIKYSQLNSLCKDIQRTISILKPQKIELDNLPNVIELSENTAIIEKQCLKLKELNKTKKEIDTITKQLVDAELIFKNLNKNLNQLETENVEILSQYEVCPFCSNEINMEKIK